MQGIIIFVHKHVLKGANQYVKGNKQRAMGQYMGLMIGIALILVNRMGVGKYGRWLVYERKRAYSQSYTVYKAAR